MLNSPHLKIKSWFLWNYWISLSSNEHLPQCFFSWIGDLAKRKGDQHE